MNGTSIVGRQQARQSFGRAKTLGRSCMMLSKDDDDLKSILKLGRIGCYFLPESYLPVKVSRASTLVRYTY